MLFSCSSWFRNRSCEYYFAGQSFSCFFWQPSLKLLVEFSFIRYCFLLNLLSTFLASERKRGARDGSKARACGRVVVEDKDLCSKHLQIETDGREIHRFKPDTINTDKESLGNVSSKSEAERGDSGNSATRAGSESSVVAVTVR